MFLHNALDLIKKSKVKKLKQLGKIQEEKAWTCTILKDDCWGKNQHATMAISFMILVAYRIYVKVS